VDASCADPNVWEARESPEQGRRRDRAAASAGGRVLRRRAALRGGIGSRELPLGRQAGHSPKAGSREASPLARLVALPPWRLSHGRGQKGGGEETERPHL
jgi:hypothetical protein